MEDINICEWYKPNGDIPDERKGLLFVGNTKYEVYLTKKETIVIHGTEKHRFTLDTIQ